MHKHTRSHTICSVTALNGKILSNKSFSMQLMQPSRWQEQRTSTPEQRVHPHAPRAMDTRKLCPPDKELGENPNPWSGLTKILCLKSLTEDEQQRWQAQDRAGNGTTFEELCFEPLFGFTFPAVKLTGQNPPSFQGCCVLSSPSTCSIPYNLRIWRDRAAMEYFKYK